MSNGWVLATKVDGGTEIFVNLAAARTMARHRRAEQTNISWLTGTDSVLVKETPEELIAQLDHPSFRTAKVEAA